MDSLKTKNNTEVSLARAISKYGYTSRSLAAQLIKAGKVTVNNRIEINPMKRVSMKNDIIRVENKVIKPKKNIYIIMNKPKGTVTTRIDELNRKTIYHLLGDIKDWIFPVGRLDKDSSGLLLLTNDTRFGEKLTNPNSKIPKTYFVTLNKPISLAKITLLESGIKLENGYKTLPAKIKLLINSSTQLEISIIEGKNRQIRYMFKAIGYKVIELKRIRIGKFQDNTLPAGSWRYLKINELKLFS